MAVYVRPTAPATLSVVTAGLTNGGTTNVDQRLAVRRDGLHQRRRRVGIFADGGSTPIGTATAAADGTADITTNVALTAGAHTFVAKQLYDYDATTVGNRTIAAGTSTATPRPTASR